MANTQDKLRPSAAQAPFRRGKNKPKEDGKQAPAPTNGKGLNKSAESSESANATTARTALARLQNPVPTHTAGASGTFASEPREPSNKLAESSESAGAIVECPAPKRSVHKKYVSIGGQASIRQFDRCYTSPLSPLIRFSSCRMSDTQTPTPTRGKTPRASWKRTSARRRPFQPPEGQRGW